MLNRQAAFADIVQPTVVGLTYDRIDRFDRLVAGLSKRPIKDGLRRCGYCEGVGQQDGCLDLTQLNDLGAAVSLPKPLPTASPAGTFS